MRRVLIGLAVAAVTVLSVAGPASAARGQVMHFRFQEASAEAAWVSGDTGTFISAGAPKGEGSGVVVDQTTTDPQTGDFTETIAKGPAVFTIDQVKLTSAAVSASGLQGTTCTYDAEFNQIGECSSVTVDVTAAWTGQGPILRGVTNEHFKIGPLSVTTHRQGTSRDATVTATIAGLPAPLGDLMSADLGVSKVNDITLCIGGNC
jgi:hypothetical protein